MRAVTVALVLFGSACGGDDGPSRETGELGGVCYPNGTCNVTLYCSAGICVTGDGGMGDGGADAPTNNCADDSALEPNDTTSTAFDTGVAGTMTSISFAALAICPAGDKDLWEVNISSMSDVVGTIVYESPTPALTVSILNAGGTAVLVAGAPTGTPLQVRATGSNFPPGKYFIQVSGPGAAVNNYTLQVSAN